MIDLLQSQITLLSRFAEVADDDILTVGLTAADVKGHCLVLRSLQAAAETCYAQCYQAQRQDEQSLNRHGAGFISVQGRESGVWLFYTTFSLTQKWNKQTC